MAIHNSLPLEIGITQSNSELFSVKSIRKCSTGQTLQDTLQPSIPKKRRSLFKSFTIDPFIKVMYEFL